MLELLACKFCDQGVILLYIGTVPNLLNDNNHCTPLYAVFASAALSSNAVVTTNTLNVLPPQQLFIFGTILRIMDRNQMCTSNLLETLTMVLVQRYPHPLEWNSLR